MHKWIGNHNIEHGTISLYSFSWLQNMTAKSKGLETGENPNCFLSIYDDSIARKVVQGILKDPRMFCGISVTDIQILTAPTFENKVSFYTASPILIKRKDESGKEKHYTFFDADADEFMTQTLRTKLRSAGLNDDAVQVFFDKDFLNPKTKIVSYGAIKNKVNVCPIIIEGSPEQIAFAWEVGIGNSTGIGFGALK